MIAIRIIAETGMETPIHKHQWIPGIFLSEYPAMSCNCGEWTEITKTEFKQRFKTSFWRSKKEHDDLYVVGGYKKKSLRRGN